MSLASSLTLKNGSRTQMRQARGRRHQTLVASSLTTESRSDVVRLGKSDLMVPAIGLGAWSWGDRSGYWGYGREYGKEESRQAYKAVVTSGLGFIDTAEVYGFGKSEEFLGEFMAEGKKAGLPTPQVATKFAPQPWRYSSGSVVAALKASLARMQLPKTELYMLHWPGFFFNAWSNEAYVEGLSLCLDAGLTDAIGVSNYNTERIKATVKALAARGHVLASNQVQYSLLYRKPERSGLLETCRENGVTLVAYSPLTQGVLSGKYSVGGSKPSGPRGAVFSDDRLRQAAPVLDAVKAVAEERGKSMSQVALNWCVCKGTLPIPGAKSVKQVEDIAGALSWRLTDGEVAELDSASARVPDWLGAPFENW